MQITLKIDYRER